MKCAAVVGRPITHSLSPLIHGAWIDVLGIGARYEALEPKDDDFEGLVCRLLEVEGYSGLNVTAPYKERAYELANDYDGDLFTLRNANVLYAHNDEYPHLTAMNTDVAGLLDSLSVADPKPTFADRRVLVLGAGATARTAAVTLKLASAEVTIANRTFERAASLARDLGCLAVDWRDLPDMVASADILINATSAVHAGDRLEVDLSPADIDLTVMEMSYRPLWTPLLQQARALGLRTVDGLSMLIGQARPSFEVFFGVAPPTAEVCDVRALCLRALGEAG